ncbi:MAG: type IX secretion system PorP/SprF family membrane protein [Polaribacter sp.]|jgi:type IX secretion system PorP/SprF family membrane protein
MTQSYGVPTYQADDQFFDRSSSFIKNLRNFSAIAILLLFISADLSAQDKHFTQFYASPITLNPALTGAMQGRYRLSSIYRDQWRGVLDNPYVTFSSAVDVNFDMEMDSRYKDQVAVGLLFFNDKVSGLDFSTNQIALSAAFHKGLDFDKTQFLSLGIQGSLSQRNINYEDVTFEDEFDKIDQYSLATGEILPENNFSYPDLNIGLNYRLARKKMSLSAGVAMHHIFRPNVSFFDSPEDQPDLYPESKLYRQLSAQVAVTLQVNERVFLSPRVLWANQGPHMEINSGMNFRYKLNNFNNNSIHLGSWVRPVRNEDDSFSLDAVVALVGIELGPVTFGLSYDANLTDLSSYQQRQGAIEFSLAYIGSFDNEDILCPKF